MIIAELQVKTSSGKKTPNCANCDRSAYFKFRYTGLSSLTEYLFFVHGITFSWRKCANCMSYEEREAVKRLVQSIGDLEL